MRKILSWLTGLSTWGFWLKIGTVAIAVLGVLAAGLALRRNGRLAERADAAQLRVKLQQKQEKDRKDVDTKIDRIPVNGPERNSLRRRWTRSW